MDHKTAQAILVLVIEEQRFKDALLLHIKPTTTPSDRVRKGCVSVPVSDQLDLVRNPAFYKRLKSAMKSLGSRSVRVDGKNYWSNVVLRSDTSKDIEIGVPNDRDSENHNGTGN